MTSSHVLLEKKKNQKKWYIILFFSFFIIISVSVFLFYYKQNQDNYLDLGLVKKGPVVEAVYGLGTLVAENTYQLKLGVTSKISALFVKEGQQVQRGDKLLSLAGESTFYAPFSGTITSLPFHTGEVVFAQVVILSLSNLKHNYVLVSLEQESALKIKPQQSVMMNFEGQREQKIEGKVTSIYPNENQFYARLDSKNFPENILPGMTVDVAIKIRENKEALLIPASAIQSNQKIYLLRNGKRISIPIKVGSIDGGYAEVLEGDVKLEDHILLRKN